MTVTFSIASASPTTSPTSTSPNGTLRLRRFLTVVAATVAGPGVAQAQQQGRMTHFVTSVGKGNSALAAPISAASRGISQQSGQYS
jgi:hypothetical protein